MALYRQQFEQSVSALRRSGKVTSKAVGKGIEAAWMNFCERFASLASFRQLPKIEQLNYIDSLAALEAKVGIGDPYIAFGLGLFKLWLGALSDCMDGEVIELVLLLQPDLLQPQSRFAD